MKTIDYFPIEVERTNWEASEQSISAIRRQVFIEEQNVPVELELDGKDADAKHWLAFSDSDSPIATARLTPDGKVGRMAVLKPYRDKGVGSAIMRKMIDYAVQEGIAELTLSAQRKAIPFYQGFGFVTNSDFYEEAGITHKAMRLSLQLQQQRYQHHNKQQQLLSEERQHKPLTNNEDFFNAALALIQRAHTKIRIFSDRLLPELYDDKQLCDAIYNFVTGTPSAHVEILVRDIEWLGQHSHRLHEMGLRLSSHIEFRKLNRDSTTLHNEFLLIDNTGILYRQNPRRFEGYTVQYAPLEASELAEDFDNLWRDGELDPALRRLHI